MGAQDKNKYMLLIRENNWSKGLSPEETEQTASHIMAWFKRLMELGTAVDGSPLEHEGKIVSGRNGRLVTDRPFAESKEVIGGYFFLHVDSLDEAVAIAQQFPALEHGATVEVRIVSGKCPLTGQLAPKVELATVGA
jgi:hypothetical protein